MTSAVRYVVPRAVYKRMRQYLRGYRIPALAPGENELACVRGAARAERRRHLLPDPQRSA